MKIVADENITQVAEYFGNGGELVVMPGRAIDSRAVMDADVLLVRSVTVVDKKLLRNSKCKFVGTATSGIDHIDVEWLTAKNIRLGWARGCNAESVVDYVFSAMAALSEKKHFDWHTLSYGIAGCGEVGSRLAKKLLAMKCQVYIYDPFLNANHPLAEHFASYEKILEQDVISFHVPITSGSPWPTYHMLGRREIEAFSPQKILINAARGGVVDNKALLAHLSEFPRQQLVLDAWEGEPDIDPDLMERVAIGTPHIAGYSREGKLNGTRMVHNQFADFFGLNKSSGTEVAAQKIVIESPNSRDPLKQLNHLIRNAYDVMQDHARMQKLLQTSDIGPAFDAMRKNYPIRREFSAFAINASEWVPDIHGDARILGFTLVE